MAEFKKLINPPIKASEIAAPTDEEMGNILNNQNISVTQYQLMLCADANNNLFVAYNIPYDLWFQTSWIHYNVNYTNGTGCVAVLPEIPEGTSCLLASTLDVPHIQEVTASSGTISAVPLEELLQNKSGIILYNGVAYNYSKTVNNIATFRAVTSYNDADSNADDKGNFNYFEVNTETGAYELHTWQVNSVNANPTVVGGEAQLTAIEIGGTKYKVNTFTVTENADGTVDLTIA